MEMNGAAKVVGGFGDAIRQENGVQVAQYLRWTGNDAIVKLMTQQLMNVNMVRCTIFDCVCLFFSLFFCSFFKLLGESNLWWEDYRKDGIQYFYVMWMY